MPRRTVLACLMATLFLPALCADKGFGLARARAQVLVVDDGAGEAAQRRWRRRVRPRLSDPTTFERWVAEREPIGTVPRERLSVLVRIEARLVQARQLRSRLQERQALVALLHAQSLAERNLDVPGMASWYAEVQLAIAITAAQVGQSGVSAAALSRAASVDPGRTVQAAEARPEVAARAHETSQALLTGPRGSFEVRADARGAVVSLDDVRVAALPATIEASVGPHVIRIDAPGYHAWARVVMVFEGSRPPLEVTLSPTPRRAAVARARRSVGSNDRSGMSAYFAMDDAPEIVHLRPGAGALDRALLTICRRDGCAGPRLLEPPIDSATVGGLERAPLATSPGQAARWLLRSAVPVAPPTPWWERWYVWTVAGAVLTAGVGAALGVVSSQQAQSDPPLILVVDPGGLPRSGVD